MPLNSTRTIRPFGGYRFTTGQAFYFSFSTGDDSTGDGSYSNPWKNFHLSPLAATNAIEPGTRIYFKRGDTWENNQGVNIDSPGTEADPIVIDAYGDPGDPLPCFRGSSLVAETWTNLSGNVWYIPLYSGVTDPGTVMIDRNAVLNKSTTSNPATLNAGQWKAASGNLYIRLTDNSDPNGHDVYTPQSNQWNGQYGGLITNTNIAVFLHINNIRVEAAQAKAVVFNATDCEVNDCEMFYSGRDGLLFNGYTPNNIMADRCVARRCEIAYNMAWGGGQGQGFTCGSSYCRVENCHVHHNFMAGVDFLDYSTDTFVRESIILYNLIHDNGIWQSDPSYDMNIYLDGPQKTVIYGNIIHSGGNGPDKAGNSRNGITIGSEHALTKPCTDVHIVNNLIYNINWCCVGATNVNHTTTNNVARVWLVNNTLIGHSTKYQIVWATGNADRTANNWVVKNNIFRGGNSGTCNDFMVEPSLTGFLDLDKNLYYTTWSSDGAGGYNIYKYYNGSTFTNYNFTQWQAASGKDTNSVFADPRFINFQWITGGDYHLQRTSLGQANDSPGIGIADPDAWICTRDAPWAAAYVPNYVTGSTRSDNALDTARTDAGYHYEV